MRRAKRLEWLSCVVLLASACDDEPATGPYADAASPGVVWDAATGFDAQAPDAALPAVDTGVVLPPADTGVIGPTLDASGSADATVVADAAGGPDASVGDGAAPGPDAQMADGAVSNGDASTPRFPPVTDTGAKGPYTARTIERTGPDGTYTIYHPAELAPNGALNPIISWGNGGFTTPPDYPLLPHLASHGFVVIASNDPFVVGSMVRAGVDWIVQQNENASSPFHKKLDVRNIAGVGYSNGGLATLDAADDPRYVTIVIISGANISAESRTTNMPKLHTPIAYLCTEDEASQGNCAADYAVVTQPAFFGVMKGSGHTDVTTLLGLGVDAIINRLSNATAAWLRWQLMAEQSHKTKFVGASCGLCTDSNWTVQQKNLQ